jgi:hypothetical protein
MFRLVLAKTKHHRSRHRRNVAASKSLMLPSVHPVLATSYQQMFAYDVVGLVRQNMFITKMLNEATNKASICSTGSLIAVAAHCPMYNKYTPTNLSDLMNL